MSPIVLINFAFIIALLSCNNKKESNQVTILPSRCGDEFVDASIIAFDSIPINPVKRIYSNKLITMINGVINKNINFSKITTKLYEIKESNYAFNAIVSDSSSTKYIAGFFVNDFAYFRELNDIVCNDFVFYDTKVDYSSIYGEFTCQSALSIFYRMDFYFDSKKIRVTTVDDIPSFDVLIQEK